MRNFNIPKRSNLDPSTWDATKKDIKMTTPITFGQTSDKKMPFVLQSESTRVAIPNKNKEELKIPSQEPVTFQKPLTIADANIISTEIRDNLDTPNVNIDTALKSRMASYIPEEDVRMSVEDAKRNNGVHDFAINHQAELQSRLADVLAGRGAEMAAMDKAHENETINYSSDNVFGRNITPNEAWMYPQLSGEIQKSQVDFSNNLIKDAILTAAGGKFINSTVGAFGEKIGAATSNLNKIKKVGSVIADVEEAPEIIGEHLFSGNKILSKNATKLSKLAYKTTKNGYKRYSHATPSLGEL